MTERNWKSGPPPHIGWWNTLRGEVSDPPNPMTWRWWDGANWSYGAHAKTCAPSAMASWQKNEGVVWSDYYPEGARVPRVDPSLPGNRAIVYCLNAAVTGSKPDFWTGKAWEYAGGKPAPAPESLNPAYVPGSRLRLSESVRAADVDFQGAMKRNTEPHVRRRWRREDDTDGDKSYLRNRSNGQAQAEAPDRFHGVSSMDLMRELFRRLG